jgi:type IV pilus assembly protein PilB
MPDSPTSSIHIAKDETSQKLDEKLSSIKIREEEQEVERQATAQNLSYIDLSKFPISQDAIKLIPREKAEVLQTICFLYTGEEMRFGSLNPTNPQVTNISRELAEKYHANVKIYLISEYSFNKSMEVFDKIPTIIHMEGITITAEDLQKFNEKLNNFDELQSLVQDTGLTDTVNLVIAASLKFGASDIHIEAEKTDIKVRFRIDGVLHDVAKLPMDAWPKINSRIKLLSGLKLNIGNKPQDGRFSISMADDAVDVRVSTIPSTFGESIVMRLLKASSIGLEFEKLGLKGKAFNDLKGQIEKPNGMVISTGPTGSGKTTTLYAILNKLNNPDTKIITLEDPVEYKLAGIVQSQVDNADGNDQEPVVAGESKPRSSKYTFARGLRAILRQDPDVVMVGEIRDLETADTAINAALTGHMMLSTIHTNSAAGTIPRLLAMGVQPFLLAPSLNAIIGQRLIRRLCTECKVEDTEIDNTKMTTIMNTLNEVAPESGHKPDESALTNLKFYKSVGCDKCHGLGYKGRVGIYEVMTMSPEVEKMILSGKVSEYEMEKLAVSQGMITMFQDGLLKAMEGITSIEEVFGEIKD